MIVVTTETIAGFTIAHSLGLVYASLPTVVSKYEEGIKDLNGRTYPDVPGNLERRRSELLARLEHHAQRVGADAVVAMRFHDRELSAAWRELCAYGTAVVLRP